MSATKFPYSGWVLSPSYRVTAHEFVVSVRYGQYHRTAKRTNHHVTDIFANEADARKAGRVKIALRREKLKKTTANLEKHEANLKK